MERPHSGSSVKRTNWVLAGVTVAFFGMVVVLLTNTWGRPNLRTNIPLVDPSFLDTTASRKSYSDLVRDKEDVSDFDCYLCHERGVKPQIKFDANHHVIVPEEHSNIVLGHGSHDRNNHCFNCHNENNRETFYIRDGRELKFSESSTLCGSCHGPTYNDWEAGAHGRTNGYWDRSKGPADRLDCVNCHNPHSPRIPSRKPAPGPNSLHPSPPKSAPTH